GDELARCQVPERAVRPLLVVVEAPGFDLPRDLERNELMHLQALVAQAPVEGLDVGILHGFARMDEVERDAPVIRPVFARAGGEFRAVIDGDGAVSPTPQGGNRGPRRRSDWTLRWPPPATGSRDSTDRPPSARGTAARPRRHHARSPCGTVPGGLAGTGAGPQCRGRCAWEPDLHPQLQTL